MTLEDINYLAQTIAAVAVVGSLIYLAIQTQQAGEQTRLNTQALKAKAGFDATHSWATLLENALDFPDDRLALIMAANAGKPWEAFSDADRFWLAVLHRVLFGKLEGQYFLFKYGSLDPDIWEKRRDWAAGLLNVPFYGQWWVHEKVMNAWTEEFVAAIEAARKTSTIVPWVGPDSATDAAQPAPVAPAEGTPP